MIKKRAKDRSTFSVMCYLKKIELKNGEYAVYVRITVKGQMVGFSLQESILPSLWNQSKEICKGKDRKSAELNDKIDSVKIKLKQIYKELELEGKPITAPIIKDIYFGKSPYVRTKTILEIHKEHNERCSQLVGIDYSQSTIYKFNTSLKYLMEFMKDSLRIDDIELNEIKEDFIRKYELYLKVNKKLSNNTTIKQLKIFKKMIRIGLANDWIKKDPFYNLKFRQDEVHIEFLAKNELEDLINKEIDNQRLSQIRDVFIFCCFTGLAFVDVKTLQPEHIITDNEGAKWIRKARTKTNNMSNIPLLDIPNKIIEKYVGNVNCIRKGQLLPVPTNAKMNVYLKEIATICNINKNLTTHTARHTFATTVTLANKVALKNVSKMLGHSSTRMTEHYAKVLDHSIMDDMKNVNSTFLK